MTSGLTATKRGRRYHIDCRPTTASVMTMTCDKDILGRVIAIDDGYAAIPYAGLTGMAALCETPLAAADRVLEAHHMRRA